MLALSRQSPARVAQLLWPAILTRYSANGYDGRMTTSAFATLDRRPVLKLTQPFRRFAQLESSSSIVLLAATVSALYLANSHYAEQYQRVLRTPLVAGLGRATLSWPIASWINDVFMANFFLLVGLEVKRELLVGELASVRRAILPVLAAAGGMLGPVLIYWSFNHSGPAQNGWGVPVATDIAFSLAVLTAFGSRIPLALRVFLASLAIADDIGGVLVIAVAYTRDLHLIWLAVTLGVFLACLGLNKLGVTQLSIYLGMGALLWITLHASGIHPTLSGVLLALAIPSRSFLPPEQFVGRGHVRLEELHKAHLIHSHGERREHLGELQEGLHLVEAPLDRLQAKLHPWVSYGIMPLFALANAGIAMGGFHPGAVLQPAFLGIALGLVLGKPLGITLLSWVAVRMHLAELPHGVSWRQLHAVSWVAGIGFTVAIFIAGLAFGMGERYTEARIAILLASSSAAIIGAVLLSSAAKRGPREPEARC